MTEDKRVNWDTYFMGLADAAKIRANCSRREVGSILVRGHDVVSLGYNGTPAGTLNCFEGGCERCAGDWPSGERYDLCMCVHAEINSILMAARQGLSTRDTTMYITIAPCMSCIKEIIQAGVLKIIHGGSEVPMEITPYQVAMIYKSALTIYELIDGIPALDLEYGKW